MLLKIQLSWIYLGEEKKTLDEILDSDLKDNSARGSRPIITIP
jgi:hypothetical protein